MAQGPVFGWARGVNGSGDEEASCVAADNAGNVYIAGYVTSPEIDFGTGLLESAGGRDIYLVKCESDGTPIWARLVGGGGYEYPTGLAVDDSGNCVLVGLFGSDTLDFGDGPLINGSPFTYDLFVAKYDPGGSILWSTCAGQTGTDAAQGVAIGDSGTILVAGYFDSPSIDFGTGALANSGFSDFFVVKYLADGTALWAKRAGGTGSEIALGVTADDSGNSYLAGHYDGATLRIGAIVLPNSGSNDMFVAKFDPDGDPVWADHVGGSGDDWGRGIAVDDSGNVYLAGDFLSPTLYFDVGSLPNSGSADFAVVKFGPSGAALWGSGGGGEEHDGVNAISTNPGGGCVIAGVFHGTYAAFGEDTLHNTHSTGILESDLFVAMLDPDGLTGWARNAAGDGWEFAGAVVPGYSGGWYLAGGYNAAGIDLDGDSLSNAGGLDAFLTEIGSSVPTSVRIDLRAGWNLLSVPLQPTDASPEGLFPAAISAAFSFDSAYRTVDSLAAGLGYWIKFDSAAPAEITGVARKTDTIGVAAGWNLIGGLGVPFPVADIETLPPGIIASGFFGFGNGYEPAGVLAPGRGYWVKITEAGLMVMDAVVNNPP
jgi:hypothetical protein